MAELARAHDVQGLLRALMADDAGRPRLTWYGPDGERIELSAKTLNNWVAKTANLLIEELDVATCSTIGISLPAHWRTVVWLLATWSTGAHAVVVPPAGALDVLVTERPDSGVSQVSATAGATLVAVSLPALATRFGGELPDDAIDAATQVRLQPDGYVQPEDPDAADPAFTAGGKTLTYGLLLPAATQAGPHIEPGVRLLTGAGPADAIEAYLAPLLAGGSLVLHAGLDAAAVQRIAAQEGVTASYR